MMNDRDIRFQKWCEYMTEFAEKHYKKPKEKEKVKEDENKRFKKYKHVRTICY